MSRSSNQIFIVELVTELVGLEIQNFFNNQCNSHFAWNAKETIAFQH